MIPVKVAFQTSTHQQEIKTILATELPLEDNVLQWLLQADLQLQYNGATLQVTASHDKPITSCDEVMENQ
jgi:ribosome-associated translation inhibitor RaiA